jgi:lipoprotein
MKKALIALVALTFLASCGNKAAETVKTGTQTTVQTESVSATTEGVQVESSGSTETIEATTATASSSASLSAGCDDYVKYYSCAMEKSGFTGDALTQAVDELKKGFAELPADLQTQACTQGLDAFKQSMPVSGC